MHGNIEINADGLPFRAAAVGIATASRCLLGWSGWGVHKTLKLGSNKSGLYAN